MEEHTPNNCIEFCTQRIMVISESETLHFQSVCVLSCMPDIAWWWLEKKIIICIAVLAVNAEQRCETLMIENLIKYQDKKNCSFTWSIT